MRRPVPWLVAGLGTAPAVAGVLVLAAANRGPADFGRRQHTPLQETQTAYPSTVTFSGGSALWTGWHALGAALLVLGLLVLTRALAWPLGRRAGVPGITAGLTPGVSERRRVADF